MCFLLRPDVGIGRSLVPGCLGHSALAIMLGTTIVVVNNNLPYGRPRRYKGCMAGDAT